jgi:hypothetical protein
MKNNFQESPGAASPGKKRGAGITVLKSHAQIVAEGGGPKSVKLDSIDYVVMNGMKAAFGDKIDSELLDVCFLRHLLPANTINALASTAFLCRWMLPAKVAERATGIRVSVLVAEGWFAKHSSLGDELFNCFGVPHGNFHTLEECLLDHALRLKGNPKFNGVMRAMKDADECLTQLGLCELWDEQGREDRVDFISGGDLQDCDFAGAESALDGG